MASYLVLIGCLVLLLGSSVSAGFYGQYDVDSQEGPYYPNLYTKSGYPGYYSGYQYGDDKVTIQKRAGYIRNGLKGAALGLLAGGAYTWYKHHG